MKSLRHRKHAVAIAVSTAVVSSLFSGISFAATTQQKPVTIRFMNWWDQFRQPWMEQIIKEFQKQYPHITVKNQVEGWGGRADKVLTSILGGDPPEVIMVTRQEVINLADKGGILPLDPFIKESKLNLNIFYPAEVTSLQWEGKQYALPMPTTTGNDDLYVYNKTLFEEAGLDPDKWPATWAELDQVNRKITRKGADGRIEVLGVRASIRQFLPFLYSNNGQALTPDARKITWNSREGVEALQFMVNLIKFNGGNDVQNQFLGNGLLNNAGARFYRDEEAIVFENVSIFAHIANYRKDMDWGVGLIPYNQANPKAKATGVAGIQFGWGYVIPKGISPEKQKAAYQFIEYLTTHANGTGFFMLKQLRPSPVRRFNEHPVYYEANPNWKTVLKALETDVAIPMTPVHSQLMNLLQYTAVDAALKEQQSPKVALDTAAEQAQRILDEYWASKKK